jgi:hypothetical protein
MNRLNQHDHVTRMGRDPVSIKHIEYLMKKGDESWKH